MTKGKSSGVARSCVACRASRSPEQMLRFVLGPDGSLVFDGSGRLPGRGAHVCPEQECVRRAVERRGFDRSFHQGLNTRNPEQVLEAVRSWYGSRLIALLGLARRAGRLVAGGDEVQRATVEGLVKLIVLSADISPRRGRDVVRLAGSSGVPLFVTKTKDELGHATGRPPTAIIGILEGPQLAPLQRAAQRLVKFGGASLAIEESEPLGEGRLQA